MSSPPPATPRVSAWEWTQTALLSANLAWTTLCLGGYRPETMVVTSALTGALLAVHLLARVFSPAPRTHPAGWLLLPFLAYAAANVQWHTPTRWLGWRDWFGWAQMIVVFWVVLNGVRSSAPRRALFSVVVALGVVAVALGCYQRFVQPDWLMLGRVQAEQFLTRASGSFGIPNSLAALLLLLLPPLGALAWQRGLSVLARVGCGVLAAWLAFGLVLTISRGAWFGLALALIAWPLFSSRWQWRTRIGVAAAAVGALVLVGTALYFGSAHVRDRLVGLIRDRGESSRPIMWHAGWQLFREHPALGSGAGSYNVLFEKFRPEGFLNEPQWAHNDYLNTLSDYGAVGFALFFGAGALIAWRCVRHPRTAPVRDWLDAPGTVAALGIGVLAFALQLVVEFHLRIPALAMAFAVIAALIVGPRWPANLGDPECSTPIERVARVFTVIFIVAGICLFVMPAFEAEALRYRARQRVDRLAGAAVGSPEYRARLAASRAELARAVALDPANAQAWADVAYVAALCAYVSPEELPALASEAETAANRAVALAPACVEFWIRRGVARDMRGRWFDGSLDFARATTLAPNTAWVWFYYADHLSKKASERGMTEAALALCLRLDPQNQDGLALRQHLAISSKVPP